MFTRKTKRATWAKKMLLVAVTLLSFAAFSGSAWAESGCHDRGRAQGGGGGTTTIAAR